MSEHQKNTAVYDESSIQEFSGIHAIRKRPSMYVPVGNEGVFKLFMEIFTNSVDEYIQGFCKNITITVNSKENRFSVTDDGRGIPIGTLEDILTKTHMGGKFDSGAYKFSGGMNGVGTTVTNALSKTFNVIVMRDNKRAVIEFKRGEKKALNVVEWQSNTGTMVQWIPDDSIMGNFTLVKNRYAEAIEATSFINPGLRITLAWDSGEKVYYSEEGIKGFLEAEAHRFGVRLISDPVVVKSKIMIPGQKHTTDPQASHNDPKDVGEYIVVPDKYLEVEAAIGFTNKITNGHSKSYVNGLQTSEGGYHINGISNGYATAMKKWIQEFKKTGRLDIQSTDITDSAIIVVSAKHSHPLFNKQTKDRLESQEFFPFARNAAMKATEEALKTNAELGNKVSEVAIRVAKARAAAKEARENIIGTGATKRDLFRQIDPKKMKACKSNDKTRTEIFIVEGDSAGASASGARSSEFQALFYLKGKILNVAKSSEFTDELKDLIQVLGCGSGDKFDITKLRYSKIICLTDADSDGGHITSLLANFFMRVLPQLVLNGHIYVAKPPLYAMHMKGKTFYIPNAKAHREFLTGLGVHLFDLVDETGKVVSKEIFQTYSRILYGFAEEMEFFQKWLNISPVLLERIVIHLSELENGKYEAFEKIGFHVKVKHKDKEKIIYEFDRGREHYFFTYDRQFYAKAYLPIFKRLAEIRIPNVFLRMKKSGQIYGGSPFLNSQILTQILERSGAKMSRFKGLGEMNANQLAETAMDPETRTIVRITAEDATESVKDLDGFFGKDTSIKKKLFSFN